jgi:mRNA interferase HigB
MKLIGLGMLRVFCDAHADCRKWIANWINDARASRWNSTHDVKERYPSASFLADNVVIFNVRGNAYRLEVQMAFNTGAVFVKWIGTHAEYSRRTRYAKYERSNSKI